MRTLVPFLEHRRDAVLPAPSPRTVMMSPAPAWTPEQEPESSQRGKEKKEQKQETETAKPKPEWAMVGHSPAIIRIGHRRCLTRRRLDGDGRSLGNACLKSEEGDPRDRGDEHQS